MAELDVSKLPTWFLEQTINDVLPGLANYVRDVDLPANIARLYKPGAIVREPGFTDATSRVGGMRTTHRFSILSNHMADLGEITGDEQARAWGLNVAQAGSRFLVLDVYESGGKTQILMFHLPEDERWKIFSQATFNVIEDFIPGCRERFDAKKDLEPISELDGEWLARCQNPVGVDGGGSVFAVEGPVRDRLKPLSEIGFRAVAGRELFVRGVRDSLCLTGTDTGSDDYPDAVCYGYIDHERGLNLHVLAEARLTEDGNVETARGLDSLYARVEVGAVMQNECADLLDGALGDYAEAVDHVHNETAVADARYAELRAIGFLDRFRSPEWPDDVQALLISDAGLRPEAVWLRLEELDEKGRIRAKLLNEPAQETAFTREISCRLPSKKRMTEWSAWPLWKLGADGDMSGWHPFEGGKLVGQMGCEGIVLRDEEHDDGARITLERCGDHCEIVCGDYGSMMHTGFAGLDDADAVYEAMRSELGEFVSREHTNEERLAFYESFTSKW